jgi:hypothetical protein
VWSLYCRDRQSVLLHSLRAPCALQFSKNGDMLESSTIDQGSKIKIGDLIRPGYTTTVLHVLLLRQKLLVGEWLQCPAAVDPNGRRS